MKCFPIFSYLQPDEDEVTRQFKQDEIARAVDITSAKKQFDLDLPFGSYRWVGFIASTIYWSYDQNDNIFLYLLLLDQTSLEMAVIFYWVEKRAMLPH